MIVKSTLRDYIEKKTGLKDVKFLPQNVRKNSKPAKLVSDYGNKNPDKIVWLYHKQRRYVGMLVANDFIRKEPVLKWVASRLSEAKETKVGKEYTMVLFK